MGVHKGLMLMSAHMERNGSLEGGSKFANIIELHAAGVKRRLSACWRAERCHCLQSVLSLALSKNTANEISDYCSIDCTCDSARTPTVWLVWGAPPSGETRESTLRILMRSLCMVPQASACSCISTSSLHQIAISRSVACSRYNNLGTRRIS